MLSLNAESCELFNIPFYQFAQMKKFCPEDIPAIKADYKYIGIIGKRLFKKSQSNLAHLLRNRILKVGPMAGKYGRISSLIFKYEFNQNSAAIFSVLLNRRRLRVCLDWHCYRADRSQINVQQYNQWLDQFDFKQFADFDIWREGESEYDDFRQVKQMTKNDLILRSEEDFWCIGKSIEKSELGQINPVSFITQTIQALQPIYEYCHQ